MSYKVDKTVKSVEGLEDVEKELAQATVTSLQCSDNTEKRKWKTATFLVDGKIGLSPSLARQRRKQTFEAARKMHGGKEELSVPAAVGLIDTALVKCPKDVLVDVMSSSKRFTSSVMPSVHKKSLKSYESSDENMIRSIAVYYSGGIAGKQKYRKIYKDSSYRVINRGGSKSVRFNRP